MFIHAFITVYWVLCSLCYLQLWMLIYTVVMPPIGIYLDFLLVTNYTMVDVLVMQIRYYIILAIYPIYPLGICPKEFPMSSAWDDDQKEEKEDQSKGECQDKDSKKKIPQTNPRFLHWAVEQEVQCNPWKRRMQMWYPHNTTGTWGPRHSKKYWLNKLIRECVYLKGASTLYIHQVLSYKCRNNLYFTIY